MPNPFFQFKQFLIHQDQCAMKVCTDACIFGAWFAQKDLPAKEVLDIGSGTGLLMLMLAQKQESSFEGIEIDVSSFHQLKENVAKSKWSNRITVTQGDVRDLSSEKKFDFIISNPPFYENNLKSKSTGVNTARHSKELTLEQLLTVIDNNLSSNGSFGILIPYYRLSHLEKIANEKKFLGLEKLLVKQTPAHDFFRAILHFSRNKKQEIVEKELIIQQTTGKYTEEFIELLKDYYLYLENQQATTSTQ
jgi:tRNA1Val (adenine37-N6)-methyltransferase